MASAGSIFVDLLLNDSRYVQGLSRSRLATSAAAASWQRDVNRTRDSFTAIINPVNNIGRMVTGLSGIFAGAFSVQQISQYSDEWKQLEGRLNLVSDSSTELAQTQERLFQIAQESRSDLGATVTLYQRLSSAVKGLGIEQEDVFQFTEQLNKQLITAGLSSNEASAAVYQLTQAFNKGKLDGDEFRTILEAAPPILEALEHSLGKTRAEILKMSSDGELAPRVLVDAINEMSAVTDERFAKFSLTISQAFQELDNAFLKFIGQSSTVQSSAGLTAEAIQDLAKWVGELSDYSNLAQVTFAGMATMFLDFAQNVQQYRSDNALALGFEEQAGKLQTSANKIKQQVDDIGQYLLDADERRKALLTGGTGGSPKPDSVGGDEYKAMLAKYDVYISGITKKSKEFQTAQQDFKKLLDAGQLSSDGYAKALANLNAEYSKESGYKLAQGSLKEINGLYEKNESYITGLTGETIRYNETMRELAQLLDVGRISQDQYNESVVRAKDEILGTNAAYKEYETYITGMSREFLAYRDRLDGISKAYENGSISAEQYYTALENIDAEYDQSSQKFGVWAIDIEEAGKQASRNIHDAFADFLFDPFADGLGGMVEGFANTMRRMIAEATSAKILSAMFGEDGLSFAKTPGTAKTSGGGGGFLSGVGGFVSGLFDGFFADGGFVKPGHFGVAGEAGAELVYGGNTGATVIPQGAIGGKGVTVYQTNHFAPGVSKAELAQIIPQIQKSTEASVLDAIGRGGRFSQAVGRRT